MPQNSKIDDNMSFPEIGPAHAPEIEKISGWNFQNLPIRVKFSPFVERDWLLFLLMKSGPNSLLDLVFSLNKFQHHDPDSKQFLYFGDGVVWVESLQASWANGEKMQNSIEGFAVGEMLNMMMNNGNKVLSRIKIRCSGIWYPRWFRSNASPLYIEIRCSGICANRGLSSALIFYPFPWKNHHYYVSMVSKSVMILEKPDQADVSRKNYHCTLCRALRTLELCCALLP